MSEVFDLLVEHPFFRGMTEDQIRVVAETGSLVSYDDAEFIFTEGGKADACFLILDGNVALGLETPGGGRRAILTLHAGDLLGWSWLYPPHRWSYDAHVHSATKVIRFDGLRLKEAADSDPVLGYELMKRFTDMLVKRMQSIRIQLLDVYSTPR
ncbi:MAG: cyclic nucleotide-binding domain-containing protein [Actinomycetota bacterium]|nr:cyclic nucleotide-binding domain-containing protein [Actinomycetota bacterium]